MKSSSSLPLACAEAIANKRLLVFLGAGVSMLPPSNLPSWWGFNESLLDEAKRVTLEGFPNLDEAEKAKIRALTLDKIPVQSFSETLVRTFAGGSYFPMLETLDSDQPNLNHRALAELGRLRIARSFVTTNFDTLIEQSFRQLSVPLRIFVDEEDYRSHTSDGSCELYKLHGSVKFVSSLVDTVTQKLRGIGLQARTRLATMFRNYHVLVLGYSGADLAFGDDYLAFSAIDEDCPGITWLIRPGTTPSERVQQAVAKAGKRGAIVEADLPDFFEHLGVELTTLAAIESGAANTQAVAKSDERIRAFFSEVGKYSSISLCINLFRTVGDEQTTQSLSKSLAAEPELSGPQVPVEAAIAFFTLAGWAIQNSDFDQGIHWLKRTFGLHAGLVQKFKEANLSFSPESSLEWNRNLSGAYNNLGLCYIQLKDYKKAQQALVSARHNAEAAGDRNSLSLVYINMAQLNEASRGPTDRTLNLLRIARAFAQDAGNAQAILESRKLEAMTLISIAEYDEASARLDQVDQYITLLGKFRERLDLNLTLAQLALRRGKLDAAREIFVTSAALAEEQGSPGAAEALRFHFCVRLGFHLPFRQEVLAQLQGLLKLRKEGIEGPIDAESINGLISLLLDKENPFNTPNLEFAFKDQEDDESRVRMAIARCEFNQDLASLPRWFEWLWQHKYSEGNPDRLLNLANAFLIASSRAQDAERQALAYYYTGISCDLLGDMKGALEAYQSALKIGAIQPDRSLQIVLQTAVTKSKLHETSEAETIITDVISRYKELADTKSMVNAMQALADHFVRHERLGEAIEQLQTVITFGDTLESNHLNKINQRIGILQRRLSGDESAAIQAQNIQLLLHPSVDWSSLDLKQLEEMQTKTQSPEDLTNIALMAASRGFTQKARDICEELLAVFIQNNDLFGQAGCLANLGAIAHAEGKLEQAREHAEHSLEIFYRLEDIDKQILMRMTLASYCLVAQDDKQAKAHAEICLNLAAGRRPTRETAIAWNVLGLISSSANRMDEFLHAARSFISTYQQIAAPDLEPIYEEYLRTVSETDQLKPVVNESHSNIELINAEALRLKRLGDYDDALTLLNDLVEKCGTTEERAGVEGNRGNIFQSAGRHEEAITSYRSAAELFRKCDQSARAKDAEIQATVSMRLAGDATGAASTLRELLKDLPATPQRVKTIITLCNTLCTLARERRELDQEALKYIAEAHDLFAQARKIQGVTTETLGSIETNISNLFILENKPQEALRHLELAKNYFLRCNSEYLKGVETQIDRIKSLSSENGPPHED